MAFGDEQCSAVFLASYKFRKNSSLRLSSELLLSNTKGVSFRSTNAKRPQNTGKGDKEGIALGTELGCSVDE